MTSDQHHSGDARAKNYEPPALAVLGTVHELTLLQDKKFGKTDGFTFMGIPITNAS